MQAPPTDWLRALNLLDEALTLEPAQRQPWLKGTAAREPQLMPLLHKLLGAHGRVEQQELLVTLPKLAHGAAHGAAPADSGATGMRIGPFELLAPLGRGGMGSVWRARYADGRLKRDVAIKLPAPAEDAAGAQTLRERFERERDFLAQLQHPHIARLYDAGVSEGGQPWLAMEYVAGQPIDAHCDALRLAPRSRLQLFLQVLDAVGHAHQQLVLHRDLKAGNVLVDEQGQVRLLDFGVARLLQPPGQGLGSAGPGAGDTAGELTERAGAAFTLGHAAPEQLQHGALSTATDVYALGVMLYRLLSGVSPYQPVRDSRGALEDAVLLATPAPASSRAFTPEALAARQCASAAALRKALQGDLDLILAKALKKNPAERYPTVAALADDLRRHLAQQPISARPDSRWYRASRFVARNRWPVAAGTLAGLALAVTAGVAAWQAHQSDLNAQRAAKEAARANAAQKFFAGLLSNADPEKNLQITAGDRQILDQALATAKRELSGSPETLALVFKQLGELFIRLDVPAQALEVQRQRVALFDGLTTAPVDDQVDAQIELARGMFTSSNAAEREQALPRAMAAHRLALARGASATLVVSALCLGADIHTAHGRDQDALKLASLAVEAAQQARPAAPEALALAYAQLGQIKGRLSDFDGARLAFQSSLRIDASEQGRGKVEQVQTRMLVANLEHAAGRYEAARREALDVIQFAQQQLGPMEGTLVPARARAVLATVAMGRFDEAFQLAPQLLTADLAAAEPLRSAVAHEALGVAAMLSGRFAEAGVALASARSGLAMKPRRAAALAIREAELRLRQGQAAQAAAALATMVEATAMHKDEAAMALERLGVALARTGQATGSQEAFRRGCALLQASLAPHHPNRVRCESYLVLADGSTRPQDKLRQLEQLQRKLDSSAPGPTALALSLAAVTKSLERTPASLREFPLLN